MDQDTKNEMAGVVDHSVWDTFIPKHGKFAKAFEDLADRVKELSQDLGDIHRGAPDPEWTPLNQELAWVRDETRATKAQIKDQEAKLAEVEAKVDKIAAGLEALLKHAGVAAE